MEKNEKVQDEIDSLTERSSKLSRRKFTKAAAFAIPALSAFSVSKQALGMTGSGSGGGMMNKKRASKKKSAGKKRASKKKAAGKKRAFKR